MKTPRFLAFLAFISLVVIGCQKAGDRAQNKQYDLTAKVVAVDAAKKTVTLDHKDIPGLMQAMTMEFKVENPQVLEGLSPGDQVQGRLEVRSGDYIITNLSKR